ncbi:hypothetical protein D9M71_718620 [compost metagenome]
MKLGYVLVYQLDLELTHYDVEVTTAHQAYLDHARLLRVSWFQICFDNLVNRSIAE